MLSSIYTTFKDVFSPPVSEAEVVSVVPSEVTFCSDQLMPCIESLARTMKLRPPSNQQASPTTIRQAGLEEILEKYIQILSKEDSSPSELPDLCYEIDENEELLYSVTNPLRTSKALRIFEETTSCAGTGKRESRSSEVSIKSLGMGSTPNRSKMRRIKVRKSKP